MRAASASEPSPLVPMNFVQSGSLAPSAEECAFTFAFSARMMYGVSATGERSTMSGKGPPVPLKTPGNGCPGSVAWGSGGSCATF